MAKRLAATFVTLVYDATLKSFWRRAALSRFLRQAGIAESFVAAWSAHESKRQFLDRLFAKLVDHPQGQDRLMAMARDLAEQTVFPDLQGWEDSVQKLRDAQLAVKALNGAVAKLENQVQSDRDREASQRRIRELQAESKRSRATLELLAQRLAELARQMGSQEAGYGFQTWFYDLMDFYEVVNRRPYSAAGRQIDGSITVSGTTYLVELKFTQDQAAAPDVDSILAKINDKADNTMGIMLSMSGFSGPAVSQASGRRTPLLLMDHRHVYACLSGGLSFDENRGPSPTPCFSDWRSTSSAGGVWWVA
jgi:TolA-binding protein